VAVAGVWWAVRAEARRRWASWLALAALVALVAGTVLVGAAAARRTSAAFPDYLQRYGYDAVVFSSSPHAMRTIEHWREVGAVVPTPIYLTAVATADGQVIPGNPELMVDLTPTMARRVAKLASGRLAVAANEVDVGFEMQQEYHLHVGSKIAAPFYAPSQRTEVLDSSETPPAHGPSMVFTVVGVLAAAVDFPTSSPNYSIYVDPAFASTVGRHVVAIPLAYVRLTRGALQMPRFTYAVNHLQTLHGFSGAEPIDDNVAAIESAINPQVIGWWLFALLAGLAGLALVAQALSRQSVVARDGNPTLSALGLTPLQLFGVGMARAATVGVVGAAGALAFAAALSPLTPVGEARVAEPSTGVVLDPLVFGLGTLAVVLGVLVLGLWPAWRDAQVVRLRRREERFVGAGASRLAAAAARTGAPPTAVVGIRHALERGHGRTSVPVTTALLGTVAAVGALVATSVFGSSLTTLLSTPRLYGQDFQVVLSSLNYPAVQAIAAHLRHDPGVEAVSIAQAGKIISINGVTVNASLVASEKGPLVLTTVAGREPSGPHELALGSETLRQVHSSVGGTVKVVLIGPSGSTTTGHFKVVGSMVFPPSIAQGGGLGVGAVVPIRAALGFACQGGTDPATCRKQIDDKIYSPQNSSWGMAIRVAPGAAGAAAVRAIDTRFQAFDVVLAVPTNLVNFGEAVSFPLLLGVTLAVFGAATLAHLLLASASRRRREFALLKVLGFERRQVGATVGWQSTTVGVIGIVVGVPIGLAVGNLVWQAFASRLGAVPLTDVPVELVVVIAVGVIAAGLVLALVPALVASRSTAAAVLREE
jgi:ABC-type antimicrobial peptide transport system permease subunit